MFEKLSTKLLAAALFEELISLVQNLPALMHPFFSVVTGSEHLVLVHSVHVCRDFVLLCPRLG